MVLRGVAGGGVLGGVWLGAEEFFLISDIVFVVFTLFGQVIDLHT